MGLIQRAIDGVVAAVSPQKALERAEARRQLARTQVSNTGYSHYGANTYKKEMAGWIYNGGSSREDIEDNLPVLRERCRDLYMGVPLATGAIKTMRTNVVVTRPALITFANCNSWRLYRGLRLGIA